MASRRSIVRTARMITPTPAPADVGEVRHVNDDGTLTGLDGGIHPVIEDREADAVQTVFLY